MSIHDVPEKWFSNVFLSTLVLDLLGTEEKSLKWGHHLWTNAVHLFANPRQLRWTAPPNWSGLAWSIQSNRFRLVPFSGNGHVEILLQDSVVLRSTSRARRNEGCNSSEDMEWQNKHVPQPSAPVEMTIDWRARLLWLRLWCGSLFAGRGRVMCILDRVYSAFMRCM